MWVGVSEPLNSYELIDIYTYTLTHTYSHTALLECFVGLFQYEDGNSMFMQLPTSFTHGFEIIAEEGKKGAVCSVCVCVRVVHFI
jgi:hypothetical protein